MQHVSLAAAVLTVLACTSLGAAPGPVATDDRVPALVRQLANDDRGYQTAIELAAIGEPAVPSVIRALSSGDANTRKWAARTLTNMGPETAAAARAAAVVALAAEKDPGPPWYMVQCVDVLRSDPAEAVPVLRGVLGRSDRELKRMASDALGRYGQAATAAKPDLLATVAIDDGWLQRTAIESLRRIGLGPDDMRALAAADVADASDGVVEIFRELLSHPTLAVGFVERHPKLLAAVPEDDLALITLFARRDAGTTELREYLLRRPNLPKFVRVDFAKGEKIGHVMTWPRRLDPTLCFPQAARVVKVAAGADGRPARADVDRFAADEHRELWVQEGLVSLQVDGKWGFIDPTGNVVIQPVFDGVLNFSEGLAVIVVGGKYGYADRKGDVAVRPQYEWRTTSGTVGPRSSRGTGGD